MFKFRNVVGLITALLLIFNNSYIVSMAATSNELRQYIGLEVSFDANEAELNKEDAVDGVVANKTRSGHYEVVEDNFEMEYVHSVDKNIGSASELQRDIDVLKTTIQFRIEHKDTANNIVSAVDSLLDSTKRFQGIKKDIEYASDHEGGANYIFVEDDTTEVIGDEYNVLDDSFDITDNNNIAYLDYNIGQLGENAPCVVKQMCKIVTPWGYTKRCDEASYTNKKLLGVDMYAKAGWEAVSQFNGRVFSIEDDTENAGQVLKIYHGNSTYTVYKHIYVSPDIEIDSIVSQGQIIGTVAETRNEEPEKENHMFYQLILDNRYVNPLLVYGTNGKKAYEEWFMSNPVDNIISKGEKYYNDCNFEEFKQEHIKKVPKATFYDFNKAD